MSGRPGRPVRGPGMARLCEELAAVLLAGDAPHESLAPALLTSLPGVSCLRYARLLFHVYRQALMLADICNSVCAAFWLCTFSLIWLTARISSPRFLHASHFTTLLCATACCMPCTVASLDLVKDLRLRAAV